jgi:hypothetical protein|tara:strand:+ start:8926 stop:9300 length:375 start_codon:yes stop_codon:yes gene_type:complete
VLEDLQVSLTWTLRPRVEHVVAMEGDDEVGEFGQIGGASEVGQAGPYGAVERWMDKACLDSDDEDDVETLSHDLQAADDVSIVGRCVHDRHSHRPGVIADGLVERYRGGCKPAGAEDQWRFVNP